MTSKTLIQEGEKMKSYALSPDGEWLVYQSVNAETSKESLVVSKTREFEEPVYLPWEEDWDRVIYWLNNEQVIINMYSDRYDRVMVLNPISGEKQVLIAKFPELYFSNQGINWNGAGLVVYNPTLTMAVYAEINHHLVMWDMVENREIARVNSFPMNTVLHTASPQWTSSGDKVIVSTHEDNGYDFNAFNLFSIDENGTVQKLTNFSRGYPRRYNLSPDGRYIAMLIDAPEKLAVLDTNSYALDVYCIEGDTSIKIISDYRTNPYGYRDPNIYKAVVWSPDSRQLINPSCYLV